jgi:branched-chain amino acid transport system ATP-binding protein
VSAALEVRGLGHRFGGVEALAPVDLTLRPGEIVVVTGANGAGKSTLLAGIAGYLAPTQGRVSLGGRDVFGLTPGARAGLGLACSFQAPALVPGRTALENVALGRHRHREAGLWATLLLGPRARAEASAARAAALDALAQVGLQARADVEVERLSYGEQKRVDLARALALAPSVLLLDEPAAGAGPEARALIVSAIAAARSRGAAVLLAEHDAEMVAALADRRLALGAPEAEPLAAPPPPPPPSDAAPILRVEGLTLVARSGAVLLDDAGLTLAPGEVVSVTGPNAAGKTTLLGALAGRRASALGRVHLGPDAVEAWPAHRRARAGLALVDRTRTLIPALSVQDNLRLAALHLARPEAAARRAAALAELPALASRLHLPAGALSGGEQQLLALARARLTRARVLLVDEPTLGLTPAAAAAVARLLAAAAAEGAAILLAEQTPSPLAHRHLQLRDGRLSAG